MYSADIRYKKMVFESSYLLQIIAASGSLKKAFSARSDIGSYPACQNDTPIILLPLNLLEYFDNKAGLVKLTLICLLDFSRRSHLHP